MIEIEYTFQNADGETKVQKFTIEEIEKGVLSSVAMAFVKIVERKVITHNMH